VEQLSLAFGLASWPLAPYESARFSSCSSIILTAAFSSTGFFNFRPLESFVSLSTGLGGVGLGISTMDTLTKAIRQCRARYAVGRVISTLL